MKAILTCAGYATRLWPLTKDTPKPLLEVKDRPIVEHLVHKIKEVPGVDHVYVVTNDKFAPAFEKWAASADLPLPVTIVNDGTTNNDDRLGQIGDVQHVLKEQNIEDDVIVAAGDNLFNFSLRDAHSLFEKHQTVVNPLYDVGSLEDASQLGTVVMNDDNRFIEFYEKHPSPKSTLASLGVYFFPKSKLPLIGRYLELGNSPDKMGLFLAWLIDNDEIAGHVYTDKWFDIGWIEALEIARRDFRS